MPIKTAKGETRITFLKINKKGISPTVKSSTGYKKKGKRAAISYLEKEITVKRKSVVAIIFALGSSL